MLAIQPFPKTHPNLPCISHAPLPRISSSLESKNPKQQPSTSLPTPGKIKRLVLSPEGRTKINRSPDREFYSFPRFVTHVDDGFTSALTDAYRERLKPGWEILDLMSSWVSHLPRDVEYKRVVGHGMNAMELARNTRLEYFFVKDLNLEQRLPLEDSSFDAVLCAVSIQYLQCPEKIVNSQINAFPIEREHGVEIGMDNREIGCTINHIACEIMFNVYKHRSSHSTTMAVLESVGKYSWGVKAVIVLVAFAMSYGEFWLVTQLYHQNPLALCLAMLKGIPNNKELTSAFENCSKPLIYLFEKMVDLTKCMLDFEILPVRYTGIDYEATALMKTRIHLSSYWAHKSCKFSLGALELGT